MNLIVAASGHSTSGAQEVMFHSEDGTTFTLSVKVKWSPVVPEAECTTNCSLVQCESIGGDRKCWHTAVGPIFTA